MKKLAATTLTLVTLLAGAPAIAGPALAVIGEGVVGGVASAATSALLGSSFGDSGGSEIGGRAAITQKATFGTMDVKNSWVDFNALKVSESDIDGDLKVNQKIDINRVQGKNAILRANTVGIHGSHVGDADITQTVKAKSIKATNSYVSINHIDIE